MKNFLILFVFVSAFPVLAADLVMIRTINGVNMVPRQSIVEGPEGYLKSLFLHSETMKDFFGPDGSIFVYVDDEAMKYALAFIRNGSLPTKSMLASPVVKNDLNFLLPGIKPKRGKAKKMKVWECAAFCDYERDQLVVFMSTTHVNLTDSWQNLISLCRLKGEQAYLVTQTIYKKSEYLNALASMRGSCVHRISE